VEAHKAKVLEAMKLPKPFSVDPTWPISQGKSETEWQAFVKTLNSTIARPIFISTTSASFQFMISVNSLPATATLQYVSAKDNATHTIDLPVRMFLTVKPESVKPSTSSIQKKPSGGK
jgi:hypothetical protein